MSQSDSALAAAITVVKEAARAEGHRPELLSDLETLSKLATNRALRLTEQAASIRAAVATLDEWQSECRDAPVVR